MVNTSNSNGNAFQLPPRKKQRVEVHEVDTEGAEYICKANDVMRIKFLLNLGDFDDMTLTMKKMVMQHSRFIQSLRISFLVTVKRLLASRI